MTGPSTLLPIRGRLRLLAVLLTGLAVSLAGFFFTQDAHRRQVEAQFNAAARERAESVLHGFEHGFEDVAVLRSFFEASDDVTRADFDAFLGPILARHSYIQAFQWLPEVTPRNRAVLEAEARRLHPDFQFFKRDAAGRQMIFGPGESFYAVQFVAPLHGNEVTQIGRASCRERVCVPV